MVRIKHRYLIIQIVPEDRDSTYAPSESDVISSIREPFTEMYGVFGAGSVLTVMRLSNWLPDRRLGILKVPREWATNVINFFQAMDRIATIKLSVRVHHNAGTIDQAQRWMENNEAVFL